MSRLQKIFAKLEADDRAAFIPFIMAGDPSAEETGRILAGLADAGADVIELGMPFTDPMADGPSIQRAGLRALKGGQTLARTLEIVRSFRAGNETTPIVLMGYYNPIYAYGTERFVADAVGAGVDGVIVVDLPPEEDAELYDPAHRGGLDFVRLTTPTTDDHRLPDVIKSSSGFVYYVSVAGVTGGRAGDLGAIREAVTRIRRASGLPVAVGFGVRTTERAAEIARDADAVVVGSAIVDIIETGAARGADAAREEAVAFARGLADAIANARTLR